MQTLYLVFSLCHNFLLESVNLVFICGFKLNFESQIFNVVFWTPLYVPMEYSLWQHPLFQAYLSSVFICVSIKNAYVLVTVIFTCIHTDFHPYANCWGNRKHPYLCLSKLANVTHILYNLSLSWDYCMKCAGRWMGTTSKHLSLITQLYLRGMLA